MANLPEKCVLLKTNVGDITIELFWAQVPRTATNFYELAKRGYYNGVVFHRVIANFMIQGGDPTGTGRGGESIYGPTFADEIHPQLKHTSAGLLSMANAGPNTNGSQFFITLAATSWLDGKHAVFGRVIDGLDIVKSIGSTATDRNDRPKSEIKIVEAVAL
ncbi:cyclophilin-like domain-containing protein [Cladochytrium replicatum]|nr:cyclophilin-like domain-containing protein [Cladochytrium replicatum]